MRRTLGVLTAGVTRAIGILEWRTTHVQRLRHWLPFAIHTDLNELVREQQTICQSFLQISPRYRPDRASSLPQEELALVVDCAARSL